MNSYNDVTMGVETLVPNEIVELLNNDDTVYDKAITATEVEAVNAAAVLLDEYELAMAG